MKKVIPLIRLTAQFAEILRTVGYTKDHMENDAEHSFQLALVCWSTNHQYKLGLSDEKILKVALVHDLVEIYAGDTDAHGDKVNINAKKEKEEKAFKKLSSKYGEFKEILREIETYEKKKSPEAQLVYILDKFIPDVNVHFAKSEYYKKRNVSFDGWKKWLFGKIDYETLNPKFKRLVDESIKEVEEDYKKMFADF